MISWLKKIKSTANISSATMLVCITSFLKPNYLYFSIVRQHWRYSKRFKNKTPNIKYALVLDFEATCDNKSKMTQEIIEIPCLKLNTQTLCVESTFHEYVRPVIHPELTDFCVELTGILQEVVDSADPFPNVFRRFEQWRFVNDLTVENSVYVTSGDWDLGKMMPNQCELCGVAVPPEMFYWIDLKKFYGRATGFIPKSLLEAINKCGLQFQGRQHSGLVDSINICNVLRRLSHEDYSPTSQLVKTASGYKVIDYPNT